MGFNHLHYNLLELGFRLGAAAGREECPLAEGAANRGSVPWERSSRRVLAKKSQNIYSDFTRDNTLRRQAFGHRSYIGIIRL